MSIYTEATLGQSDNQITFNDYTTNPVFRTITRAPRSFQVRQDDIPIPFESGVSDFLTLLGSTLYVIDGKMYPQDESSYDSGLMALRKVASLDWNNIDVTDIDDDGYVPYTWGEINGGSKTLFVKPLYVRIIEDTRQGFVQPFTIYCKIKDPTIFGADLQTASTAQVNPTTSTGAAQYSFKYPIVYGSSIFTVSANAENRGNMPAYPFSIDVYGPVTTPTITNTATGESITISVTLNSQTDNLHIFYDKDTLVATLNGINVVNKITTASTLFKIQPGTNPIQLSGASVSTGAYAVVTYRDAYPLA